MNSIYNLYNKNKKNIIIIFSIMMLIISLINIYYVVNINVTSNDECLWVQREMKDSSEVVFQLVKVDGVTWKAGIRDGDIFLEIEGEKVVAPFQAQRILNQVKKGEFATYKIQRGDEIFETKVEIKKLINFGHLGFSLLSFIWFFVGFVVLMANIEGKIQKKFYRIGLFFVLTTMAVLIVNQMFVNVSFIVVFIDYTALFGYTVLPFLIIDFFFTYPQKFQFYNKKTIKNLLLIFPIILFVFGATIKTLNYLKLQDYRQFVFSFFQLFDLIIFIALIIGGISLVVNYLTFKEKRERKQFTVIVFAYIIGTSSMMFTSFISPLVTDSIFNSPEWYMPIIFVFIIPVAFGYSIFRYQLMDISTVVKNTIVYGAATLSLAALFFGFIYLLGHSISQAIGTEYQSLIAGVIFISFALVFQKTKDRFQDYLTSKFYPEQFAHQKLLIKFSNEITTVVGLENIFDMMTDTYVNSLKIDKFGIIIKENDNEPYKLVRKVGIQTDNFVLPDFLPSVRKYLYDKKQIEKVPAFDYDEFNLVLPEISEELKKEEIYTVVPLVIKSKIIGLLLFGLKHAGSRFDGKDLELLTASGNQAAISIENARLYESEAEKIKYQKELQLARKIQENLLPKCIPNINNLDICGIMKPALMVGGDYFDLIPVSNNKLFVVVGDVSGKGLSAALYMTKLQTMVSMLCSENTSPREILIELNKKIYGAIDRSSFITISIALFDVEERTVKISRAGHMPVILVKNGSIINYKSPGIGVGLNSGKIFEESLGEEIIKLEKGQIFSFYSDGVVEEMNEKDELYGTDKYSSLLQNHQTKHSSEIMEEVFTSLKTFRGKREQSDDITVVIVKVSN